MSQLLKEAMEKIERMGLEMNAMQLAIAKTQKSPETLGHMPEYPHSGPSTSRPNPLYHQERSPHDSQAPPPHQPLPTPNIPIFVGPASAPLQRTTSEPLFQAHDTQYYPPEPTFHAPEPQAYNPHVEVPAEIEKSAKAPE